MTKRIDKNFEYHSATVNMHSHANKVILSGTQLVALMYAASVGLGLMGEQNRQEIIDALGPLPIPQDQFIANINEAMLKLADAREADGGSGND